MSGALSPAIEWTLFVALSAGAIAGALAMLRTMSMVRAGLYLMGSFCAIAGLFLVLSADLLAAMQIMMYVGGMLVMILFMVMMMPDPGGSMMGIAPPEEQEGGPAAEFFCPMHPEVTSDRPGTCPKCGMALQPKSSEQISDQHAMTDHEEDHGHMDMMDMAMTHEFMKPAAAFGVVIGGALLVLVAARDWPSPPALPPLTSALTVGRELLGRYMIAFEAAAILIILGVVGAVVFGRREA